MKYCRIFMGWILILTIVLMPQGNSVFAEESETLHMHLGDTLEIGLDHNSPTAEYSWTLVKDHRFQNAQRERFFQTRFSQPGTYTLDVNVRDDAGNNNEYYVFTISVDEQVSTAEQTYPSKEGDPHAVLRSDGMTVNETVYLPSDTAFIKLDPSGSEGNIAQYSLDLDTAIDSDGDGNAANDNDTKGTFLERNGSPLYIYLTSKSPRQVQLRTSSLSDAAESTATLRLGLGEQAPVQREEVTVSSQAPTTTTTESGPIQATNNGLTVSFRFDLASVGISEENALITWDFGDRRQSLLNTPIHTYVQDGTYTITAIVTDLRSGNIVTTTGASIIVTDNAPETSGSSSSSTSVHSSKDGAEKGKTSTVEEGKNSPTTAPSLGSIIRVGIIVAIILAVMVGLTMLILWIKSKATGRLQDTLEKMENTIVKKASDDAKPEPMKIKKDAGKKENTPGKLDQGKDNQKQSEDTLSDREQSKQELKTGGIAPETPITSSGPVPSWLQGGNAPASAVKNSATQPLPVTPQSVPKSPQANGATPSWLQPQNGNPQVTGKTPTPPANATGPVPSWLQGSTTKAPPTTIVKPTENNKTPPSPLPSTQSNPSTAPSMTLPPVAQQGNASSIPSPARNEAMQPKATPQKPEATEKTVSPSSTNQAQIPSWLETSKKPVPTQPASTPSPQQSAKAIPPPPNGDASGILKNAGPAPVQNEVQKPTSPAMKGVTTSTTKASTQPTTGNLPTANLKPVSAPSKPSEVAMKVSTQPQVKNDLPKEVKIEQNLNTNTQVESKPTPAPAGNEGVTVSSVQASKPTPQKTQEQMKQAPQTSTPDASKETTKQIVPEKPLVQTASTTPATGATVQRPLEKTEATVPTQPKSNAPEKPVANNDDATPVAFVKVEGLQA